jgi:hypothetical protein
VGAAVQHRDKPEDASLPIVAVLAAVAFLIFLVFAAAPRLNLPLVAATDSIYGIVSGIVGMAGLAIGGYGVYLSHRANARSHDHSYQSELGSRFQRGAELLSSDRTTAQLSGMYVLTDLAKEVPDRYMVQVLKTLAGFVAEANAAVWKSTGLWAAAPKPFNGPWTSSDLRTVDALVTIAQLAPPGCQWPNHPSISYKNRFVVEQLYACDMFIEEEVFDNMHFRRMIGKRVRFYRCSFRNTVLHFATGGEVIFENCDFSNAHIAPTDAALRPVSHADITDLRLVGCTTAGLEIGGVPYEAWLKLDTRSMGMTSQFAHSPQWFPESILAGGKGPPVRPRPL